MSGKATRTVRPRTLLPADPYESARIAGLRYVTPDGPGIRRKRSGKGFTYMGVDGQIIRDPEELKRFRSLVIPPAWTNVWICPLKNGHLQAVGRDAKGRKQYRYHPLYRAVRDQTKFARMVAFGSVLPQIRKRVREDLELPGMPKNKVLATVVRLLETSCIRVGNEEYAKANDSYGLTTLREDHVEVSKGKLHFHFRGKSGQEHDIELTDRRLAKIVMACQCIPGEELFHYLDEEGQVCRICSEDVNDYLRSITGQDFTAKDFRTWAGTLQAALELVGLGPCENAAETKKNVVAAIKAVASKLGNKPATCRKYYVHPAILDAYANKLLNQVMQAPATPGAAPGLSSAEQAILRLVDDFRPGSASTAA